MTLPHFQIPAQPVPESAAVILAPHARFTVLTARLIRMEYSPTDEFEDRASQAFWHRRQPVPQVQVSHRPTHTEIETEHLRLRYVPGAKGFTHQTLSVEVKATGQTWSYGDKPRTAQNLLGTARTLDEAQGSIHLEPGLMARAGWAVVDDSRSLVFNAHSWLEPRAHPANLDLYFFGYGHDYLGCLQDFAKVAGTAPLIPRWALGNWWSRYWAYTQTELTELMQAFRQHEVPLSVCIVDMDWHITQTGNTSTGWTGYTWNKELFPDPAGFIEWLHRQGLKTALNLHPAEGVHPHEAQYPALAAHLGADPALGEPIPFNIADPHFAEGYFKILHHPLEAQGVDFWWLDWQQGTLSALPGLDPLWWLNHLHFHDLARDGRKRPFIFSRWGGLGNHRYPIGFSGDTHVTWDALNFQPYFTATAANVGYGWWSHDIGGHMGGVEDGELYTRWVQYGVFSPIFRLHSSNNPYSDRRPWAWDAEVFRLTRAAMQLRHALIPYIYSMAWRNHTHNQPLITPMYYSHPEAEDAYHCRQQYWFGSELLAAPFTTPADPDTHLAHQPVWLPPGDWFNFFTGERWTGGRWAEVYGDLTDIPIFAKAGAIVPLAPRGGREAGGTANPAALAVNLFPGADGQFDLYEDDGETTAYQQGRQAITPFTQTWRAGELRFTIAPVIGDPTLIPAQREYQIIVHSITAPTRLELHLNGARVETDFTYDIATDTLTVAPVALRPTDELRLTLTTALAQRDRRPETFRKYLRAFHLNAWLKKEIDHDLPDILAGQVSLNRYAALKPAQLAALRSLINR